MTNESDRKPPLHVVKGEESKPVEVGQDPAPTTPPTPRRRGNGWMIALGLAFIASKHKAKSKPKARPRR